MERMKVGVIGGTGMVGQNYIRLLRNHPWFEVTYVAASPRSAGKTYAEAVSGRWLMPEPAPEQIEDLVVQDANLVQSAKGKCELVFSAIDADKDTVRRLEEEYAKSGIPVVSNNSAHRNTPDVPMMIPEVNPGHSELIRFQRKQRGWEKGLIAVKPNCSIQSYVTPLFALIEAGYQIKAVIVTTLQAVSGAGFPGPASLQMIDNVIPFIKNEEEKSELEPMRILGQLHDGRIIPDESFKISAHCNRVSVIDGHMACVSVKFKGRKPSVEEIIKIWKTFAGEPQRLKLPSAPENAIIYREEVDRPQPRMDRDAGRGMAVTVGRLRGCEVFDYRFVGLSHNTVRGAAGGAILTAELLKAKGFFLRWQRLIYCPTMESRRGLPATADPGVSGKIMVVNPKIRAGTQKDIAVLAEIIRSSFRDVADRFGLTQENCPKHPSNCTVDWIQGDMDRGVTYFIFEDDGLASGCVALEPAGSKLCYLERLAVRPPQRRRGLGRALVEYVLAEAKRSGACRVSLGIIAEQTELKNWYQKIGFVEAETKEFAHLPFRVTFMSYAVNPSCQPSVSTDAVDRFADFDH